MPNIIVLNNINAAGIERLQGQPGYVVTNLAGHDAEAIASRLPETDGIIVRGMAINRALLEKAPRLRFVCRHGVGYDNVDVPALTERGIILAVTPEANASSVAEHALMLMLALARQVVDFNAGVRRGDWVVPANSRTRDLGGSTVLLVGFGRIGTRTARLCAAFGMRVLVSDPAIPSNTIRGLGYEPVTDIGAALGQADFVSLHCPSNATTRHMVDAAFLAAMRPGSVLVNTARGTLVVESDLEAALRSGHLAGAGLDVVYEEPMKAAIPLLDLDTVIATPHVAASTQQGLRRMALAAAQNTIDFFSGNLDPDTVINQELIKMPR